MDTGKAVRNYRQHQDHVTCISSVNLNGKFVSAGLDGLCCLWDAEVSGCVNANSDSSGIGWSSCDAVLGSLKKRSSIYCADLSKDGR
jgi:WD40 repeat protein